MVEVRGAGFEGERGEGEGQAGERVFSGKGAEFRRVTRIIL